MKKIALVLLATSVISSACYARGEQFAAGLSCGYTDSFHLAKDSIAATIISASSDANVSVNKINSTSFTVSDVPACPTSGGNAKVRYQLDKSNYCDLTIHDGYHDFGPEVNANCTGKLQFNGKTTDSYVWGHSYSLKFSQAK